MARITIDGSVVEAEPGQRLIDAINRAGIELPQVCYHPQLGPVQTCDTCMQWVPGANAGAPGTCKVVEGPVSPKGWCLAYVKKA